MAWRYRKRIKIAPGVYVNVSKSGVSTTIGSKGASVNIGKNGTYINTGIPGTGIYRRDKIGARKKAPVPHNLTNTPTGSNSRYDNSGCYWLIGLLLVTLFIMFAIYQRMDLTMYAISFGIAFVAWMFVLSLQSNKKENAQQSGVENTEDIVDENGGDAPIIQEESNAPATHQGRESNLLFLSWTKECFDMMCKESEELYQFLSSTVRKKTIRDEVDRMMGLTNNDGSPWPIENKITICMLLDTYRCYRGLGYDIGKTDDEELGLLLFANKVAVPDFHLDYFQIPTYRDQVSQSMRALFDNVIVVNNASPIPDGQFFFQHVFENVAQDKMNQYMVHLYRFASTIAKADGTIDEKESKWLAGLMKSKDTTTDGKPLTPSEARHKCADKTEAMQTVEEISSHEQLLELVGLDTVKDEVARLSNFIKIMKVREKQGLPVTPMSYHCVFTGNPGTGKTTVARILAQIYSEMGLLKKGHLVETDRSGLVAEYVGQTAVKTNKIIDSALEGVLFIDEAYSLVSGSKEDFGKEAISTLLKRMEDDRDRLIVILAGYDDEMKKFIDTNPGLQSRFNRYIHFPDYDADNLLEIYKRNLAKHKYTLNHDAEECITQIFRDAVFHKDKNFGNARFVRNLFEKTLENQATRLASIGRLTDEMLCTITVEDVSSLATYA